MKRATVGLLIAFLAAGCVHGSNLEQVHAGMPRDQVLSIMGQPESAMYTPGRDCAVYSVMKDFWSRVPWSVSDRYYICYTDSKVDYFGRAEPPEVK